MQSNRILTRTALMLALALVFQSLRFILPVPPLFSTILIGALVNSCYLLAAETLGLVSALVIVVATPIVAYFQQVLPLPVFILPVAVGNAVYAGLFYWLYKRWERLLAVAVAALCKSLCLFGLFAWMLTWIDIPAPVAKAVMFAMSWPQFITGVFGGMLAAMVSKRIIK